MSFLIHLLGLAIFLVGLGICDQLFWYNNTLDDILDRMRYDPVIIWIILGFYALICELAFLAGAFLTTCWGAGNETFRTSYYRSLSRWHQLTPWLALLVLGTLLGFTLVDNLGDWRQEFIGYLLVLSAANLIGLWWILGTVAVHRDRPTWFASCRWPAACEGCGYALAGLTDEQGCPECGRPVGSSKTTDRGEKDVPALRMLMRGLLTPGKLGAAMLTRQPTRTPLHVLRWGLFFAVLAGPVFMFSVDMIIWLTEGYREVDNFSEAIEFYLAIGLTVGIYSALCGGLLLLGAGSLVGTIVRVMGKQNIMPAACKAACYSAGLIPIWVLTQALQLAILIPLGNYFSDRGNYAIISFFPLLVLVLHAGMAIYMILNIARITKAARFANV